MSNFPHACSDHDEGSTKPSPPPPFYQGPGPWDVIIRIAFLGVALIKGSMRATLRVLCRCLNIWNRVLGYCTVLILNYTKER